MRRGGEMGTRSTVGVFGWNCREASGDATAATAGTEVGDWDAMRSSIGTRGECGAIARMNGRVGRAVDAG